MRDDLWRFLHDYENAINHDDVIGALRFFAVPSLAWVQGKFFPMNDAAAVQHHLTQLFARYRAAGVGVVVHRLQSWHELGVDAVFADVLWLFSRGGEAHWNYRVAYQLVRSEGALKILSCLSYDAPLAAAGAAAGHATAID